MGVRDLNEQEKPASQLEKPKVSGSRRWPAPAEQKPVEKPKP